MGPRPVQLVITMGLWQEFREFAFKGSVLDMAIGIVLGVAFGDVVKSFVADLLSPPLGLIVGEQSLSSLFLAFPSGPYDTAAQAQAAGATVISYGNFLDVALEFLLIAMALFLVVRTANRIRREDEAAPPSPSQRPCPHCQETISLKASRCPHCTTELQPAEEGLGGAPSTG